MKKAVPVVLVVVLTAGLYWAYREGWIDRAKVRLVGLLEPFHDHDEERISAAPPSTAPTAPSNPMTTDTAPAAAAPEPPPVTAEALSAVPADINLLALDNGGRVESASSEYNATTWSAVRALDGNLDTAWAPARSASFPIDLVFSFFAREPALIGGMIVNAGGAGGSVVALEVEVWGSLTSATDGFSRIGGGSVTGEPGDRAIAITPTEARYLKLRIISSGGRREPHVTELKVTEGRRGGYTSILARRPELLHMVTAMAAAAPAVEPAPTTAVPGTDVASCAPVAPKSQIVVGPESRNVLVIERHDQAYSAAQYKPTDTHGTVDYSIYGRLNFTRVKPWDASVGMLHGKDTVVLAQICDIKQYVGEPFKKALVAWVALGNKLIIQDSDDCGSGRIPDYSFLPYKFATSNPGARGAKGDRLLFVEENTIGNAQTDDPAFLDIESWLNGTKGSHNEIGDSNTITAYDPQWCGHLFGTNVLKKNGFMEAYAHYGKGLIIYDGFDNDQANGAAYRQLVTRELAQPVNPSGLTCSARLGDFVLTTEQRLKVQPMVPGRTYVYPLTLLSNQGYSGTVKLSIASAPPDPAFTYRFDPDTVELTEISKSTLTLTTTAESSPALHVLSVRATDAAGRSNALCLQLSERLTGGIQIVSARPRDTKPTKNLEIILDVSGSMKLPLGAKTRWATALEVLKSVVEKLPGDFNVGLRAYAHRYPAKSKQTCTDTELLLPIEKLDRSRILSAVGRLQPRGETPLIYSILQAPGDLQARGGGSVVVITDGEDTCKGDPVAAARQLDASGLDVTLNIVGFTLKGKKVQDQLTTLAESTGGRYYGAQNGEALAKALWIATIDKFPYTIFDASGKQVAKGDAGGAAEELEAGEYRVVVKVADQELTAQVVVTPTSDTVLRVALKGDTFVIER